MTTITEGQAKAAWEKGDFKTWSTWWWATQSKAAKRQQEGR